PSAIKQEPYISLNPNGRLPAIEDPNTGLVLWESGAIVQYLVEQYDKDAKLRYTTFAEKWQQEAWKIFQVSGQGPYFGQLMWFKVVRIHTIAGDTPRR
ncbi:Transcriptional regulator ure2, partial [Friedmanniomyces endolithicus]